MLKTYGDSKQRRDVLINRAYSRLAHKHEFNNLHDIMHLITKCVTESAYAFYSDEQMLTKIHNYLLDAANNNS